MRVDENSVQNSRDLFVGSNVLCLDCCGDKLKEIFCKISHVLNSFLYTSKTFPSLKRCWSDQDLKKNKKMR